jgi:hypothetical protein
MLLKLLKKMMWNRATTVASKGAGPLGPMPGDFLVAEGPLPTKASSGAAATARHRLILLVGVVELQEDLGVFFWFLLDLSVIVSF